MRFVQVHLGRQADMQTEEHEIFGSARAVTSTAASSVALAEFSVTRFTYQHGQDRLAVPSRGTSLHGWRDRLSLERSIVHPFGRISVRRQVLHELEELRRLAREQAHLRQE